METEIFYPLLSLLNAHSSGVGSWGWPRLNLRRAKSSFWVSPAWLAVVSLIEPLAAASQGCASRKQQIRRKLGKESSTYGMCVCEITLCLTSSVKWPLPPRAQKGQARGTEGWEDVCRDKARHQRGYSSARAGDGSCF